MRYYWCDSLFMGPPAWARIYEATRDTKYLKFIDEEWWLSSKFLYDQVENLWYRDSRYFASKEANGKKVFWGRGNGWVLAGLARTLDYIPHNWVTRDRYETQFKEMCSRISGLQQPDGLWRTSLLDPDSFPNKETSGSAFFTYALAWGINKGLLSADRYEPIVWKGWRALVDCVTLEGKLQYVQPVGIDAKNVNQSDTEVYGPGAFLLVYNLAKNSPVNDVEVADPIREDLRHPADLGVDERYPRVICMEKPINHLMLPSHICICSDCVNLMKDMPCPICRSAVTSIIKVFHV